MLKTLNQAKKLLFDKPEKTEETAAEAVPEKPEPQAGDAKNGAGSKDA